MLQSSLSGDSVWDGSEHHGQVATPLSVRVPTGRWAAEGAQGLPGAMNGFMAFPFLNLVRVPAQISPTPNPF